MKMKMCFKQFKGKSLLHAMFAFRYTPSVSYSYLQMSDCLLHSPRYQLDIVRHPPCLQVHVIPHYFLVFCLLVYCVCVLHRVQNYHFSKLVSDHFHYVEPQCCLELFQYLVPVAKIYPFNYTLYKVRFFSS